jgi:hypothetical protein
MPVTDGAPVRMDGSCSYPRGHSPPSSQLRPLPTGRAPDTGSSLLLPTGARLGFVATTRCRRGGRPIRDRACSYPRGRSSTSSQLRPLRARGTDSSDRARSYPRTRRSETAALDSTDTSLGTARHRDAQPPREPRTQPKRSSQPGQLADEFRGDSPLHRHHEPLPTGAPARDGTCSHVGTPRLRRNYDHCPRGHSSGSSLLSPTWALPGCVAITTVCPRGHSSGSSLLSPTWAFPGCVAITTIAHVGTPPDRYSYPRGHSPASSQSGLEHQRVRGVASRAGGARGKGAERGRETLPPPGARSLRSRRALLWGRSARAQGAKPASTRRVLKIHHIFSGESRWTVI